MTAQLCVIRGPVLTYTDEPYENRPQGNIKYEPDAIIMLNDGKIIDVGPAYRFAGKIPSESQITQSNNCRIIKIHAQS